MWTYDKYLFTWKLVKEKYLQQLVALLLQELDFEEVLPWSRCYPMNFDHLNYFADSEIINKFMVFYKN